MSETSAVVIPTFIKFDPALWFHMVESTFELATPKAITDSRTKYNYIVAHIPPDTAAIVRDVIMQPDATEPYEHLRTKIIERCGESKTQEIRRLLAGECLGDRKPSELLRIMKRLAESHNIDDTLLFELFNQAMPVPVQTILASLSPISSDKAADVADRILEISPASINMISNSRSSSPSSATASRKHDSTPAELREEIRKLRKEVADLRRSRNYTRSHFLNRQRSQSRDKRLCWYHFRFKEQAKKCVPPCSFQGNETREE